MTSANDALRARIGALFADALQLEVPTPQTDLFATALLDSLGVVELIVLLEDRFGFKVETMDLELDHFRTIDAIVQFVAARTATSDRGGATR